MDKVKLERYEKISLYVVIDILSIVFSLLCSIALWYDGVIPGLPEGTGKEITHSMWQWYIIASIFCSVLCVIVYTAFGFYRSLWKYAAVDDIFKIVIADVIIFASLYLLDIKVLCNYELIHLPKRMVFVAYFIDLTLFSMSRFGYRIVKRSFTYLGYLINKKAGKKRVMIIGANYAGFGVIRSINNNSRGYKDRVPVIVVDNDMSKNNTSIYGIRVVFGIENIERLAIQYDIEEIVIALPNATKKELKNVMNECTKTGCALRMIPPISDVSEGMNIGIRDVNITDLLSRDEIIIDIKSISGYLKDKVVLVTGGGGSIGSELCRQIVRFAPKQLIIFDIYENNAYELYNELKQKYGETLDVRVSIGSIRDEKCLDKVFKDYMPKVVFHAAAHKHVPLMEYVPAEAVKNNVFGTINVADCADRYGVERFVLLSTDKAVNPTNVMGATKRLTEIIIQHYAQKSKTKFMAVRFGNVLGSNGSVLTLFQKQIQEGGPVKVTHPDIERFFMTIPEACQLVLQAAGLGKTGRISVFDMGEPIKIIDLAKNLIKLSGFVPGKDIEIVFTGLRPGEKLFEELITEEEKEELKVIYNNKIFVTKPINIDYDEFDRELKILKDYAYNKPELVLTQLKKMLPNFNHIS